MEPVLIAMLAVGAIGLIAGALLSIAAKVFYVPVDPRVSQIGDLLPGANCGGCGFAGCLDLAGAIVNGQVPPNACRCASQEANRRIAALIGAALEEREREVACIFCKGDAAHARRRFRYLGIADCRAAEIVAGGDKACRYGCLGLGTCVAACIFDALRMGEDGLPVVDPDRCTACGVCVRICPRHIPRLVPVSQKAIAFCTSHDPGKAVKEVCEVGCIACGLCKKVCPEKAIEIVSFLAVVDPAKCTGCGKCFEKCPTGIIRPPTGEAPVRRQAAA